VQYFNFRREERERKKKKTLEAHQSSNNVIPGTIRIISSRQIYRYKERSPIMVLYAPLKNK